MSDAKPSTDVSLLASAPVYLGLSLLWVAWRSTVTWPFARSAGLQYDTTVALLLSAGAIAVLTIARLAFHWARTFGQRSFRRWDLAVSIGVFALAPTGVLLSLLLDGEGRNTAGALVSFTVFAGASGGVAALVALLAWLMGSRKAALLVVSYSLLAGTSCALGCWVMTM